jgi:hypothetical protein
MKISVDVDCTPEEARRFLGLPDVAPAQQVMMEEIQRRMIAGLETMEPEALLKTWLPLGLQGMEQIQKMFWAQMNKATGGGSAGPAAGAGPRDKTKRS